MILLNVAHKWNENLMMALTALDYIHDALCDSADISHILEKQNTRNLAYIEFLLFSKQVDRKVPLAEEKKKIT